MLHMCTREEGGRRQSWRCLPQRCRTPPVTPQDLFHIPRTAQLCQLDMTCSWDLILHSGLAYNFMTDAECSWAWERSV